MTSTNNGQANENPENAENVLKKPRRILKPRLKFDFAQLFENEKGIKILYQNLDKVKVKDSRSIGESLNNLMSVYKNWHFQLFPKNDFELFTNNIVKLGMKKPGFVNN